MNTLEASMALAEWQNLRNAGLTPDQRIERLMADFFLPPIDLDLRYQDTLKAVELEMSSAPESLVDCDICGGQGYIPRVTHVYESGCGFSHPDVEEVPCEACAGNGWFICEAEDD